ncbi:MAG TPA: helix-turn-helix domain-containing protein [Baekduia sp.]|nr:helix-turn-helix domain-containing protein [Baekduia sp.]
MSAAQPMSSATGERPLRADAERNRQRILAAAAEVFAERGLGVTLDDIARHAGVGVGTVYRRFPDKEQLIDALFEDRMAALVALAEECLRDADPWTGLSTFVERGLELQAADRGLKDLVTCTAHGRERVSQGRERLAPLVGRLVERGQAAGVVRPDIRHTDVALVHLMLGAAMDVTCGVRPDAWRRLLGLALDGLRAAGAEPSALASPPLDEDELEAAMRTLPRRTRA